MRVLRFPGEVAAFLGMSEATLANLRTAGNTPRLYAPTPRVLLTTEADVIEWLREHQVEAGYRCRPPVRRAPA
jgi:predicted DNA-binding transcriptional regulator AlpA